LPSIQSVLGVFWIHSSVMGSDDWQNVTSKKHRRSKEDDVLNISKSVYVTNFPDSTSARDLWKEFDHVLNSVHDEAPQSKAAEALPNEETPEKPKEDPVQVSSNCAHPSSSRTRESKKNRGMTSFPNSHSGSFKQKAGGSIIDLMDELVNVGRAMGYKMDGCLSNKAKRRVDKWVMSLHRIKFYVLGNYNGGYRRLYYQGGLGQNMYFDHVVGPSVGFSGGITMNSPVPFTSVKWRDLESKISNEKKSSGCLGFVALTNSPGPDGFANVASLEDGKSLLLLSFQRFPDATFVKDFVPSAYLEVDFEKAFDSVKWDYLDETLKSFGFGLKWRNWISGCLNNAKGSVLVNVMETLHLSFKRIINAGLYRGISINGSLTLSHLFYADDVLRGLKKTSKNVMMGLGVSSNVVNSAANLMGCSILQLPFNYLGVKVGCNMSYIGSWDDVISKVYGVLKKLESLEGNFFNGHEASLRKSLGLIGIKVLLLKIRGIGVSRDAALVGEGFFPKNKCVPEGFLVVALPTRCNMSLEGIRHSVILVLFARAVETS
ncbi:RNA-directed DNA polymerase, eukaryota, partial [Tanacetum coccineum]